MKSLKNCQIAPRHLFFGFALRLAQALLVALLFSLLSSVVQGQSDAQSPAQQEAGLEAIPGENSPAPIDTSTDSVLRTITDIAASDGSETVLTNTNNRLDGANIYAAPENEKVIQPASVIARGADFRVIQTVTEFDAPDGSVLLKTNQFKISGPGFEGEGLLPGIQSFDLLPTVIQSDDNSTTVETVTQFVAPDGSLTSKRTTSVEFKNDDALTEALSRPSAVSEWGPHAKIMQKQILERGAEGKWNLTASTYTHLETGVAYRDENGQWQDSVPEFEMVDGGVIARRTRHKLSLASSPTAENPVDLVLPDGPHLPSRVLGLGYFDRRSGKSVVIAEIQDSQGQLTATKNEVVYADAFKGVLADLRYDLSKAGMEQDVILNEQPPAPENYGLDPASSQLEVITEFFPQFEPQIRSRTLYTEGDAQKRQAMAEPDLIDDTIDFGSMQIGYGIAFGLWDQDEALKAGSGVTVTKRWMKMDGRTILYEAVPMLELKPLLEKLPPARKDGEAVKPEASFKRKLPIVHVAEKRNQKTSIQLAKSDYPKTGVLLDYNTVSSTSSPFTFLNGTTYLVSGTVIFSGSATTIQGGTVVKYAPGAILQINNGLTCQNSSSTAYFVAQNDNSVGEVISTGAPVGTFASQAFLLSDGDDNCTLSNVEIRNANVAVNAQLFSSRGHYTIRDSRLVDCSIGMQANSASYTLTNSTLCNVTTLTNNLGTSTFVLTNNVSSCTFCAGDDYGNTIASATTVTLGSSTSGSINCSGDEDFFKIVLGSTTTINIYTTGTTDTQGYLLSSVGTQLATDDSSGNISNFSITSTLAAGTYYIRVRHATSGTGSFRLNLATPSAWTPLVSRVPSVGSQRNNHDGYLGFQFTVGSSPISVKELGRWIYTGNSSNHVLKLFNGTGTGTALAQVTLSTAGQWSEQFAYAPLSPVVALAANTTYTLMSTEVSGGDYWWDYTGTQVVLGSGNSNPMPAWAYTGGNITTYTGPNVYGPMDLHWAPDAPPTITSTIGTQTINEDTNSAALNFTVGDAETPVANLTMSGGSSNPTIIPVGNIVFGGSGATRTVTVTPATNQNGGPVTITLTVSDGTATASTNFTVNVTAVNDRPSFTAGGNVTVNEDCGAQSMGWATGFSAGPADESGQVLTFVVSANTNPSLFLVAPSISSSGTLTFTPATNANGSASITVYLQDNGGTANGGINTNASPSIFTIIVNPVNDRPSFTSGGDLAVYQDCGFFSMSWAAGISAGPPNESTQTLAFIISANSNSNLFSIQPSINSAGILSFTPTPGASGSANITVYLQDNGGTANGGLNTSAISPTFTISVWPKVQTPVLVSAFNGNHSSDTVTGTSQSGATVRYTTNGVDPDPSSTTNAPTFGTPTPPVTVKARAYLGTGWTPSDVATLVVTTNVAVTFSPNGHNPIEYSNGPLGVLMTADAGSTIVYKAGTTGTWLSTTSGSSPSIDGIDNGNGTIQAYAYKANTLASTYVTSLEYSFRLPQPTSTTTYPAFASGILTLSDAVAGAAIRYTTNGTIPTSGSTLYTGSLTYPSSTRVYAKAFKTGYIDSGYVSAWVNQLPAPKLATTSGLLTNNLTVNNPIDVWLVPNFGFDNVYGESKNSSGWNGVNYWTNDVPNGGSFVGGSWALVSTVNSVGVTPGHTYSMGGWYNSFGAPSTVYGGVINYDSQDVVIYPQDINVYATAVTYLTQPLANGGTTVYVANEQAFAIGDPTWYFNLFSPVTNFSRTAAISLGNQANALQDFCVHLDMYAPGYPYVTNVDAATHSIRLANPYVGPTLPGGTPVIRRGAGGVYQYDLAPGLTTPATYTKYTNTFSYLRPGTEYVRMHSFLSIPPGTSEVTGMEFWEGTQAQRPNLYYTLNGSTAVYTQAPTAGPLKLTLDGNNQSIINLGQRGTYYIDSALNQRTITFKVATPQIMATLNAAATSVTNMVTNATVGAAIYYTTDGTDPTTNSTLLGTNGTAVASSAVTTKWKAFKNNYTASDTAIQWAVPVFNPLSGTYPSSQNVTITGPVGAQLKVFQPNLNVLNPGAWVLGSQGTQPGFPVNGTVAENTIETRRTPYGTAENVWVARNLDNSFGDAYDPDGGWYAPVNIDKTKLYRFSVWLRKLDTTAASTSGYSYLGCGFSDVSDLTGTSADSVNGNPYFWSGMLPLNDWYLLVGYVHPAGDLGTNSSSKVYNTANQEVFSGTDFRWLPTTTATMHRTFLYYCTETGIQQEFWNPRVEVVNSVNDPIDILFPTPENSPKTIALTGNGTKSIQAMSYSAAGVSGVVTSQYTITTNNNPPTIASIADQTTPANTSTSVIGFTVGDTETALANLTVSAGSSNTGLVPVGNIVLGGSGANRTVQITPALDQSGSVTITLTVRDSGADGISGNGDDATTSRSFLVTVTTVNQLPTIDAFSNLTLNKNASLQTVSIFGITAGGWENQALTLTANSSATGVIPNPTITYSSPNSVGSLSFTPVANAVGSATITVTVPDTGLNGTAGDGDDGITTETFTVTVIDPALDSDYDGRTDFQEIADGTDQLDPQSKVGVRLGYWRFDTTTFVGEQGQATKRNYNVQNIAAWSGTTLQVNSVSAANLAYKDIEANGSPNINCLNGTVRLWFKPSWSSLSSGGTGPGQWARLLEMGDGTTTGGYWALSLSPTGNEIRFETQLNGTTVVNATYTGLHWTIAGNNSDWHQIVLCYSSAVSTVYVDGIPVVSGTGVQLYPSAAVRNSQGLSVGSNRSGLEQVKGLIDELETFNYVLDSATVQANYNDMTSPLDFYLDFDNDHVNTSSFVVHPTTTSGTAASLAMLVNPNAADFNSATWIPFTQDVSVPLGTTDGAYIVWIGTKPMVGSTVWHSETIIRDTVAASVSVITPVSGTAVSTPLIQITGNCSEQVASVEYDIVNSAGTDTSVSGVQSEITVNGSTQYQFQLYDVKLTAGLNTITLRVKDLAGNVTSATLQYTFSTAGDVTAPIIMMGWPTSNAIVGLDLVDVYGTVNEPNSTLVASYQVSGAPQTTTARVSRAGQFYLYDIPVPATGSMLVTVAATDPAGNASSPATFTLSRSSLSLTSFQSDADASKANSTVSGSVSAANVDINVNGVAATIDANGNWTASNVPYGPKGTASYSIKAMSHAQPSSVVMEASQLVELPPSIWAEKYSGTSTLDYHDAQVQDLIDGEKTSTHTTTFSYEQGAFSVDKHVTSLYHWVAINHNPETYDEPSDYSSVTTSSGEGQATTVVNTDHISNQSVTQSGPPISSPIGIGSNTQAYDICNNYSGARDDGFYRSWSFTRSATTVIKLYTGSARKIPGTNKRVSKTKRWLSLGIGGYDLGQGSQLELENYNYTTADSYPPVVLEPLENLQLVAEWAPWIKRKSIKINGIAMDEEGSAAVEWPEDTTIEIKITSPTKWGVYLLGVHAAPMVVVYTAHHPNLSSPPDIQKLLDKVVPVLAKDDDGYHDYNPDFEPDKYIADDVSSPYDFVVVDKGTFPPAFSDKKFRDIRKTQDFRDLCDAGFAGLMQVGTLRTGQEMGLTDFDNTLRCAVISSAPSVAIVHEMLHASGIDHRTKFQPEAVMNPRYDGRPASGKEVNAYESIKEVIE